MNTLDVRTDASASSEAVTSPIRSTVHPSFLERSAMRLGLWLLLWGRRRSQRRVDLDGALRHRLARQVWDDRQRSDAYAAFGQSIR